MKNRNVWLIMMLMCAVLSSPLFAQPTVGDVEALVPGGVYLDFVGNGVGYTNGGLTCTTNASDWAYPDDSDSDFFVHGDCYDSKSGGNDSDFTATISGLGSEATYEIYVKHMHNGTNYGYKWGLASASENVINPTDAGTGIYVAGDAPGGKGSYLWLLREESFPASVTGEIVLHFGKAGERTQYDGVLLVLTDPTYNPPPSVDAGPDQVIWMTDGAQLDGAVSDTGPSDGTSPGSPGGVESFYWKQESGGGTAAFSATDILDPTVTFDAAGTYDLLLQATDGLEDSNDIVTIIVRDPADKAILAHWDMEGIVDANVPESIAGNNGTYVINQARDPGTPEVVDGIIGDDAIRFSLNDGHMLNPFVLPKVFGTLSHWCKITTTARGAIYFESDESANGWGGPALEIHSGTRDGKWMFTYCDNASENNREIDGGNAVVGVWSHVVATWNIYGDVTLYVDGVAVDSDVVGDAGGGNIAPTEGNVVVGVISNFESGRRYNGDVDEIQVFNWDMSAEEIRALTALGDVPPQVDAGDDVVRQLQPGEKITLADATVVDYGAPGETTIEWTTDSRPADSNAIFTDAGVVAAEVEFPDFGVYVLRLTADDGTFVSSDTVQIEVVSPTCAHVIAEGLLLTGDIAGGGPEGDEPDCRVNLADVAAFAADFLRCNDPQALECENPWDGG